jgi:hypothetical protein
MVRRLLGRGDDVVVWNRTPAKSEQLKAEEPGRVTIARSPREVVEQCGGYVRVKCSTIAVTRVKLWVWLVVCVSRTAPRLVGLALYP